MKYPKILPFEFLFNINSTINRQAVLLSCIDDDRGRYPVPRGVLYGTDTVSWSAGIVSPDRTHAFVVNEANASAEKLRRFSFATGTFTLPAQLPTGVRRIAWAPDKTKFLVAHNNPPYLEHWDAATFAKDATQIGLGVVSDSCYKISFSPDGTKFCMGSSGGNLYIINYPSLTLDRMVTGTASTQGRLSAWSPDGNWVAMGLNTGTQRLDLRDTATFTKQTLSANVGDPLAQGDMSFNPTSEYLLALADITQTTRSVRLLRLSDKTFITVNLASGHSFASASEITWFDDYTAYWVANTLSNEVVGMTLNLLTQEVTYNYYNISAFLGWPLIPEGFTRRRIAGTVVDDNNVPVSRVVRAYHRESGVQVNETVSSAVDGTFDFFVYSSDLLTVVAVGAGAEVTKLYDSITGAIIE